jgi:ribosomal protein S11
LWYHQRARHFALAKAQAETIQPFGREEWEAHSAGSLEDANHDMITILALVGLIVFAAFEGLSALNKAQRQQEATAIINLAEVPIQIKSSFDVKDAEVIITYGPLAYSLLTTVTCLLGMVTYIRLRIAVGQRSIEQDPTDQPFQPLKLTDSLLGYMLLAFLFVVSLHSLAAALLTMYKLDPGAFWIPLIIVDILAFVLAGVAEQVTLVIVGRRYKTTPLTTGTTPSGGHHGSHTTGPALPQERPGTVDRRADDGDPPRPPS